MYSQSSLGRTPQRRKSRASRWRRVRLAPNLLGGRDADADCQKNQGRITTSWQLLSFECRGHLHLTRPQSAGAHPRFWDAGHLRFGGLLGVPPSNCKEGEYATGEIRLALALCTAVHPHNFTREWRVKGISADLTDCSSKPGDISGSCYREISSTDAVRTGSDVLHYSAVES